MNPPIVLYSTTTFLAYLIAETYYNGSHYVWCSRYFDGRSAASVAGRTPPPTSLPFEIYHNLLLEVQAGDRHSTKIIDNRNGIIKGASFKRKGGMITNQQEKEIEDIVQAAETRDFEPLMLVVPYTSVETQVIVVPPGERAHPLWIEYRIEALRRESFDVIRLTR